jgi:hypothetical protein
MSDGLLPFKGLAWGAATIAIGVALMPTTSNFSFDALRTTLRISTQSDPIRTFKKRSGGTTTGGTTTGGTTTGGTTSTPTTTTPPPTTTAAGYPELTMIPSNFSTSTELVPASIPGSAAPDYVGAFRFLCNAGAVKADDPIVYPGQPGASHLHQFYGNTSADANSTYTSLRSNGSSTCMSPLNRSGYWMPALLNGAGFVVRPDYVAIYYKRRPATDPVVSDPTNPQYQGKAIPLPNGLRFIFGFNMLNPSQAPTGMAWFNCDGPTAVPGHYLNLTQALANCPAGNRLGAVIEAPECWDGKNLDSADHRSHVAYADYGTWGYKKCDAAHPYVIPTFTLGAWYSIVAGDDTSKWSLSSDAMFPNLPKGSTLHADWFGAWDNTAMAMWTDNCINKMLNCSGGNLGNGYAMKMYAGFTWNANPRLVPVP